MRHYEYMKHVKKMVADVLRGTWDETFLPKPQDLPPCTMLKSLCAIDLVFDP